MMVPKIAYPVPHARASSTNCAWHVARRPIAAIGYPIAAVGYPIAAIGYPIAAIGHPRAAIRYPRAAIGYPTAAIGYPIAAIQGQELDESFPAAVRSSNFDKIEVKFMRV